MMTLQIPFFKQLQEYPTTTALEATPSQDSPPEATPSQDSPPEATPLKKELRNKNEKGRDLLCASMMRCGVHVLV